MIVRCKHCREGYFLGFGLGRHLSREHGITLTANDKKYLRKKRLRFCLLPLIGIGILLRWVAIAICFPFYVLYELLTCSR